MSDEFSKGSLQTTFGPPPLCCKSKKRFERFSDAKLNLDRNNETNKINVIDKLLSMTDFFRNFIRGFREQNIKKSITFGSLGFILTVKGKSYGSYYQNTFFLAFVRCTVNYNNCTKKNREKIMQMIDIFPQKIEHVPNFRGIQHLFSSDWSI